MIESKTLNLHNKNGVVYLTFPKLDKLGVCHGFSTRLGGVSTGDQESMSFSFTVGDKRENVLENYRIFCEAIGADYKKVVVAYQTHTSNIRKVTKEDVGKGVYKKQDYMDIDGLVTNEPDIVLVTQYADCTPLLFFDPVKRVAATSHGGWRGTVQEIALKTVEIMVNDYGSKAKDIICAIGPNISKCCYEVDEPVISEINKLEYLNKGLCYTEKGDGKYMLDLKETNRQILLRAGIKEENIDVADLCTCCNSDTFHSHRATGGKRGTLAAMICLK